MKRTKLPARKRRALRRVLVALAALFLTNYILHMGLLFPIQAIRENEERMGTGRTAVVSRNWVPEMHMSHLLYLTESENVTMLSGTYLTSLGWMGAFGVPLDCSEDVPIHGGWWSISREGRGAAAFYVFGRVDGPDIAGVKILVQYEDWETGTAVRRTAFQWDLLREEWLEKDGRYYFLCRKCPLDWSAYPSPPSVIAVGYDENNREIVRAELEQGAYSYLG